MATDQIPTTPDQGTRVDRQLLACTAIAGSALLAPAADGAVLFSGVLSETMTSPSTLLVYFHDGSSPVTPTVTLVAGDYATATAGAPTADAAIYFYYLGAIKYPYGYKAYYIKQYNNSYSNPSNSEGVTTYFSTYAVTATKYPYPTTYYTVAYAAGATIGTTFAKSATKAPNYAYYYATVPSLYITVGPYGPYGGFTAYTTKYVGFKAAFGGSYYFGWISIYTAYGSQTITGVAIESTADTAIIAGAVPEPGSWALGALALGAAGVHSWRARRREELPPMEEAA